MLPYVAVFCCLVYALGGGKRVGQVCIQIFPSWIYLPLLLKQLAAITNTERRDPAYLRGILILTDCYYWNHSMTLLVFHLHRITQSCVIRLENMMF